VLTTPAASLVCALAKIAALAARAITHRRTVCVTALLTALPRFVTAAEIRELKWRITNYSALWGPAKDRRDPHHVAYTASAARLRGAGALPDALLNQRCLSCALASICPAHSLGFAGDSKAPRLTADAIKKASREVQGYTPKPSLGT
jgi:hypothetical protein